ncbi:MAG TPA: hypothetical protein VFQ68_38155 [Streptosporangiaceae bacterium]|nr:hypothetical protein [Streptosporangiaceae bacterium]
MDPGELARIAAVTGTEAAARDAVCYRIPADIRRPLLCRTWTARWPGMARMLRRPGPW